MTRKSVVKISIQPYAATDSQSVGRQYLEAPPDYRGEYQRDRDRIVHSAAFRRLEYKTQVFVNHEGDMFRTRLTHSIEVAQIGRSIARVLGLNEDLTESIALAHDLGHTPFGHAGQDALNACMKEYGGFEHNLQSLRVVDELEERYAAFSGLNLTYETREGILKHCSKRRAEELGMLGRRFLDDRQPSLEAQLVNLADGIAYNNHDVDDGLRSGLITIADLNEIQLFKEQYEYVSTTYPDLPERRTIHEIVRRMINSQVTDLIEFSIENIENHAPQSIEDVRDAGRSLIGFGIEMHERNQELKRFLRDQLYQHYKVRRMSKKANRIISSLFQSFFDDPRLLPPDYYRRMNAQEKQMSTLLRARIVADYIAGMTDRFAISEYERMFDPSRLS